MKNLMLSWRMRCLIIVLAGMSQMLFAVSGSAQTYPAKPIRMIVAYPPGASTDVIARLVAHFLGERLGVSVVVDNRVGASGVIGTEAAARTAPDGYTLLLAQQDSHTLLPILKKQLPYNAEKDFVPIAKVGDVFLLIASNAKVPARTLKELIELAKAKPGELKFASAGNGGINHLVMELFMQRAGVKLLHIPYKGGATAVLGLLSGDIDVFGGSATLLAKAIDAGQLRGLVAAQEKRSALLPGVPTGEEAGFPDFVVSAWFGVFAPAGLPEPIAAKLSEAVVAVASSPEYRRRLAGAGGEGTPLGREAFTRFLREESARWREVIERGGIRMEEF